LKIAPLIVEGTPEGPERFSERDRAVACEQGAILRPNYSRTLDENYVSNTCDACGAFVGTNFLHEHWCRATAENGHDAGYVCSECERGRE
jgi:hypothetical protein